MDVFIARVLLSHPIDSGALNVDSNGYVSRSLYSYTTFPHFDILILLVSVHDIVIIGSNSAGYESRAVVDSVCIVTLKLVLCMYEQFEFTDTPVVIMIDSPPQFM